MIKSAMVTVRGDMKNEGDLNQIWKTDDLNKVDVDVFSGTLLLFP